jgi:hypothetical protein
VAEPTQLQVVRPEGRGGRSVRIRFWLAGAMWVPVLAANLIAIALGITLPFLDEILGDEPALPITLPAVEAILGALAAGMITFTGIVFSAVLVAAQLQPAARASQPPARSNSPSFTRTKTIQPAHRAAAATSPALSCS